MGHFADSDFLVTRSLLLGLAQGIGVSLRLPPPKDPFDSLSETATGAPLPKAISVAQDPLTMSITPGSVVYETDEVREPRQNVFAAASQGPYPGSTGNGNLHPAPVTVVIARQRSGKWVREAVTRLVVATGHPELPLSWVTPVGQLTGSSEPDFELVSLGFTPAWIALVSDAGGTWHPVPFVLANHKLGWTIDSAIPGGSPFVAQELRGTVQYDYLNGRFQPETEVPDPACDASAFRSLLPKSVELLRFACGYRWALVVARQKSSIVTGLFQAGGLAYISGPWFLSSGGPLVAPSQQTAANTAAPPWLLQSLKQQVSL